LTERNQLRKDLKKSGLDETKEDFKAIGSSSQKIKKSGLIQCDICLKTFLLKKNRSRHIRNCHSVKQTNESGFKCDICLKSFRLKPYLSQHLKICRNKTKGKVKSASKESSKIIQKKKLPETTSETKENSNTENKSNSGNFKISLFLKKLRKIIS
jgi:hypothetical protein